MGMGHCWWVASLCRSEVLIGVHGEVNAARGVAQPVSLGRDAEELAELPKAGVEEIRVAVHCIGQGAIPKLGGSRAKRVRRVGQGHPPAGGPKETVKPRQGNQGVIALTGCQGSCPRAGGDVPDCG